MTDLEWRITIPRGAFEKRHDDPARDYGIGCVMMEFHLIGPQGALSFEVFTGWFLPHVADRLRKEAPHDARLSCPFEGHGGPVYWHSPKPLYDDHELQRNCSLLKGGFCYCDVGYLAGDKLFKALVEGGEDGLREMMESWYARDFEKDLMRTQETP